MGNLCQKVNNGPTGRPSDKSSTGSISTDDVELGGPLTKAEYNARVVSCEMKRLKLTSCTLSYSFFSQRGYYPDDLSKANQDSYCVNAPFNDDADLGLFAVLDGHGAKGHLCAQFARDAVQVSFPLSHLIQSGSPRSSKDWLPFFAGKPEEPAQSGQAFRGSLQRVLCAGERTAA